MSNDSAALTVGLEVMIERSDGRIHEARITEVDVGSRTICVEWREQNETKGKEIDMDSILSLNPSLGKKEDRVSKVFNNGKTDDDEPTTTLNPAHRQRDRKSMNVNSVSLVRASKVTRKSNCVREVERIAQKRVERRAEQAKSQRVSAAVFGETDSGTDDSAADAFEFAKMIRAYRAKIASVNRGCERLSEKNADGGQSSPNSRITVSVRKRPVSDREIVRKEIDIVTMALNRTCVVHNPKEKVDLTKYLDNQKFRFDYAFDELTATSTVYHFTTKPLVEAIFRDGAHAMCFAYGQTGSGKTFTMGDDFVRGSGTAGIYSLTASDIFAFNKTQRFSVFCSFFEIYCGKVFDLLNERKRLRVLEDGNNVVQVVDLIQEHVARHKDIMRVISNGMSVRTSGVTSANDNSSRSHAILQIVLKSNETGRDYGKISLIDLAGSERGKDTSSSSDKTCLFEGAEINKSLLALKECIRALGKKAEHIPFRGSMLTRVLRDSFIGHNSVVSMIAMISPTNVNSEHTINTLRYADRVKELNVNDSGDDVEGGIEEKKSFKLNRKPSCNNTNNNNKKADYDLAKSANDLFQPAAAIIRRTVQHARSANHLAVKKSSENKRKTMKLPTNYPKNRPIVNDPQPTTQLETYDSDLENKRKTMKLPAATNYPNRPIVNDPQPTTQLETYDSDLENKTENNNNNEIIREYGQYILSKQELFTKAIKNLIADHNTNTNNGPKLESEIDEHIDFLTAIRDQIAQYKTRVNPK